VKEIILFDSSLHVYYKPECTGESNGILITNSYVETLLKAKDEVEQMIWVKAIGEAFRKSDWSTKVVKPFSSFAPERHSNYCKEIIDGKNYFEEVYDVLKSAQKVVYITDWWFSPKIYLKRLVALDPNLRDNSSRLDVVLKEIADRGVKVYVLLYKGVSFMIPTGSKYVVKMLTSLSPNIKVARHPNELIYFWSHHEKMLIIDNGLVLMGGIDLSFGRSDVKEHPLTDYPDENGSVLFPGQDYFNERIKPFEKIDDSEYSHIDRYSDPKLPWHDVSVKLKGPIVKDFIMHFIQYWNHAIINIDGSLKDGTNFLYPVFSESKETQEPVEDIIMKAIKEKVPIFIKVGKSE
jgi:phospholipase D1/2